MASTSDAVRAGALAMLIVAVFGCRGASAPVPPDAGPKAPSEAADGSALDPEPGADDRGHDPRGHHGPRPEPEHGHGPTHQPEG